MTGLGFASTGMPREILCGSSPGEVVACDAQKACLPWGFSPDKLLLHLRRVKPVFLIGYCTVGFPTGGCCRIWRK